MSGDFCMACAEERFGPEAMAQVQREVDAAPPFSPEVAARLRALFQTVRIEYRQEEQPKKACGH